MKTFVVFVAALLAAACLDNPAGPEAVVNQPFQLKAGATASLPDDARLRFDTVRNDSRCPTDVVCISAGDAIIVVTLSLDGGNEAHDLHTMPAQSQFSYSKYVVKLTDLQPHPRSDRETRTEDYVASFVVQSQ